MIGHELMHAYGYEHGQWVDRREHFPVPPSCADLGTHLPVKPVRPRPPRDLPRERYERILLLERAWTRKAKLAGTKLRQYRRRRAWYESRLAITRPSRA